ncbi:OmpA family protein [Actinobacillus delphinicola]|uniref:SmpA/OmlA domain-containing protein n=1 Tax=Actinobacillus delphinicola TaxID=51161 RepID=A0A448TRR6_9PAST|nr:OmpA family protein [Actinobacillus delphinicola]VEJ08616.1 SmpA/OmlA domain-containing protein [Actinobacillus delphinicola]
MKYYQILVPALVAASVVGCGNLSEVNADGTSNHLVWPKISQDTFNHDGSEFGSWPNWANVRTIHRGMNKSQIRQLIGNPQFNEGFFGVREWDYAFNYQENGVDRICQYKILFDKNMNAQSFYWFPNQCKFTQQAAPLKAEVLFNFNKSNLTPNAQTTIQKVAKEINAKNLQNITVTGYTDRIGTNAYNLNLAKERAMTVKQALIADGVRDQIATFAKGKLDPVKDCQISSQNKLIACLKPNRRVEITAKSLGQPSTELKAGTQGPAILYK